MSEQNKNNFSNNVVDLKPKNQDRVPHSQFGHFLPDEELLQSTSRIKNQRDILLQRLEKMEQSRERVSQTVFEKVKRDYHLQLETIREMLSEKKEKLKDEIKKLYVNREKLSFEINRHKEILEEAEFRHYLEEFTQSQYQEVENFETKEIEKLESDLSHISQWIRTHEELFDPEDFGKTSIPQGKTQAPTHEPAKEAAKPAVTSDVTQTAHQVSEETSSSETAPSQQFEQSTDQAQTTNEPEKSTALEEEPAAEQPQEIAEQPQETEVSSTTSEDEFAHLFADDQAGDQAPEEASDISTSSIVDLLSDETPLEEESASSESAELPAASEQAESQQNVQKIQNQEPATAVDVQPVSEEPESLADEVGIDLNAPQEKTQNAKTKEEKEEEIDLPEPAEDDYFQQDQVSEASFTMTQQGQDEESITAAKPVTTENQTEQPAQIQQEQKPAQQEQQPVQTKQEPDRSVLKPDQEKPVEIDDSISNILNSIRIEGDEEAPVIQTGETEITTEYKLIVTQGELDENIYAVQDNTSIGRSPSNDVILKDPKVSRQHAAINKYNDHYILIDLKSSNGVYVNGTKVDECVLHPGDEISIGGYKFTFQKN